MVVLPLRDCRLLDDSSVRVTSPVENRSISICVLNPDLPLGIARITYAGRLHHSCTTSIALIIGTLLCSGRASCGYTVELYTPCVLGLLWCHCVAVATWIEGDQAMSYVDLQQALHDWPYEPDKISVRKILGNDGAVRVQMRVELGILQMDSEGRPDGERPHGAESLLKHHQQRLIDHVADGGNESDFSLSGDECQALRIEASLYYRRYIAFFVLEEYASVFADTSQSLDIFDLCREHADEPEDRTSLEEFRPYVLMMDARARAYQAVEESEPASALAHVNRGILTIKDHFERFGQSEAESNSEELRILRTLAAEFGERVPKDSLIVTRKALRAAVEQERFEEAARLRDALKTRYSEGNNA